MGRRPGWSGVYPAATTQFAPDLTVDLEVTGRVQRALIDDGVHGMVVLGTVGENNSLSAAEKLLVLRSAVAASGGRIPVVAGVSELTTQAACLFARDAQAIGADGLMVLPAMVYVPTDAELTAHFRAVAHASSLPILLYNNPPAYRASLTLPVLEALSGEATIEAIKESSPDTRRFTDLTNAFGDRFALMAGLDDVALEGLLLGARGWVGGLTNAFPKESLALYEAAVAGDLGRAREIYRWFMPLLHLDAEHDLVQAIKLCEQAMGRGSERVRPPRHPLAGDRRSAVLAMMERAMASRPGT